MSTAGNPPTEPLDDLRRQLAAIDGEILLGIARRLALARAVGERKRAAGLGTRDYGQEREVIERARGKASDLGLAPELGAEIALTLIRSSLTVQERGEVAARGEGSGLRVLVIGGRGRMGGWFVRFLASQGYAVEVADPAGPVEGFPHHHDWRHVTLDHEMIVAAAPLAITNGILVELARARPPGLIFDIGSLKSPLRSGLNALRDSGALATSIHPMFGADTELLSGRHVVFIDLGVPEATARARSLFRSTMATLVDMDLESHDRLIAYVLGLSHALNIAFFTALAESGEAVPSLAHMSSTTFDAQLEVARKVALENPELYFEIQHLNDYGGESLSALLHAVERVRSVVRAGDARGFCTLMERGRAYLSSRERST